MIITYRKKLLECSVWLDLNLFAGTDEINKTLEAIFFLRLSIEANAMAQLIDP